MAISVKKRSFSVHASSSSARTASLNRETNVANYVKYQFTIKFVGCSQTNWNYRYCAVVHNSYAYQSHTSIICCS